jgi:hypothetical protein
MPLSFLRRSRHLTHDVVAYSRLARAVDHVLLGSHYKARGKGKPSSIIVAPQHNGTSVSNSSCFCFSIINAYDVVYSSHALPKPPSTRAPLRQV